MEPQTLPSTRASSSSIPRQRWSQLSSNTPQVPGPATANSRHDSTTAYRAPALRQRTGPPRSQSRADPSEQRPSTPTRPVLVRAYSGEHNKPTQQSTMSRRFFPFPGNSTPRPSQEIIFPSDKDFSIESILQAIEPDIRGTLDSIAEICGRSKLSLANEYGSHIAPLGEICATPSALNPVEEVRPEQERLDDSIVVGEEGNLNLHLNMDLPDAARDMHPFSFHRYLETLRHTASMGDGADRLPQREMERPRSPGMNSQAETVLAVREVPLAREFVSRPRGSGRDLLAGTVCGEGRSVNMATPAVVSEVYLAASADDRVSGDSGLAQTASSDGAGMGRSSTEIIHSLLGWLKWSSDIVGTRSSPALQSAEDKLRAMLDRAGNRGVASTAS
ncbi:uncharacterized protein N7515_001015 [Penicillium bovifimosum]|uniref:Uncharacterized protein n=1 Tax=Penicillium bovifimosum TaxID=126998 RepID=A0A9W9HFW0_9EURO|nr:uncharacterized protein N7515_001015 [Penicillium bovifimosum]KAJ5146451.1 hypothetical protein N7515_001015 [Penicillium bovifimosum]